MKKRWHLLSLGTFSLPLIATNCQFNLVNQEKNELQEAWNNIQITIANKDLLPSNVHKDQIVFSNYDAEKYQIVGLNFEADDNLGTLKINFYLSSKNLLSSLKTINIDNFLTIVKEKEILDSVVDNISISIPNHSEIVNQTINLNNLMLYLEIQNFNNEIYEIEIQNLTYPDNHSISFDYWINSKINNLNSKIKTFRLNNFKNPFLVTKKEIDQAVLKINLDMQNKNQIYLQDVDISTFNQYKIIQNLDTNRYIFEVLNLTKNDTDLTISFRLKSKYDSNLVSNIVQRNISNFKIYSANQILNANQINDFYESHPDLIKFQNQNSNFNLNWQTNNQYLKTIYNRTLSFSYLFTNEENNKSLTTGTMWLLDYAKLGTEKDKKYKLFFATNYHVVQDLVFADDYPLYLQSSKLSQNHDIDTFVFGYKKNFNDLNSYEMQYAAFDKNAINKPKVFFAAVDFMNKSALTEEFQNVKHYADFAVIEWDVDLDRLRNSPTYNAIPLFRGDAGKLADFIENTMLPSFNKSYETYTNNTNQWTMSNNQYSYANLDYGSVNWVMNNLIGHKNNTNELNSINTINEIYNINSYIQNFKDIYYYTNEPTKVFFYGYPFNTEVPRHEFISNISKENYANLNWNNNHWEDINSWHGITFGKEKEINFDGISLKNYGIYYGTYQNTEVRGGASGSLLINEQGLPIGLLFGNKGSKNFRENNKLVTLNSALYILFSQNVVMKWPAAYNTNKYKIVEKYNLIDGTDKNKYPHQIQSYRQRLIDVYGLKFGTKLFPKSL
ncbi:MIP family Ig-specific serine endopeptidase [Mycoplasmopsis gallinarum]